VSNLAPACMRARAWRHVMVGTGGPPRSDRRVVMNVLRQRGCREAPRRLAERATWRPPASPAVVWASGHTVLALIVVAAPLWVQVVFPTEATVAIRVGMHLEVVQYVTCARTHMQSRAPANQMKSGAARFREESAAKTSTTVVGRYNEDTSSY